MRIPWVFCCVFGAEAIAAVVGFALAFSMGSASLPDLLAMAAYFGYGVVLARDYMGELEKLDEHDRMRDDDGEVGNHEVMEAALFSMLVRCVIGGLVLAAWLFRDVLRGWWMV